MERRKLSVSIFISGVLTSFCNQFVSGVDVVDVFSHRAEEPHFFTAVLSGPQACLKAVEGFV